jgi:fumarylacetoacetase
VLVLTLLLQDSLNEFMSMGHVVWRAVRLAIIELLSEGNPRLRDDANLRSKALIPMVGALIKFSVHKTIGKFQFLFPGKLSLSQ